MMMFDKLDDTNFMLFAAKFYENPNCMGVEEFEADLNRIKYIKRLYHIKINWHQGYEFGFILRR